MIVVVMIGIIVTLSVPAISSQLRERRANQAAHEIALIFRQARARAMGRGAAVMVRFDSAVVSQGTVELREARDPTSNDAFTQRCIDRPVTSCQGTTWDTSSLNNHLVTSFDPSGTNTGVYHNVQLKFMGPDQLDAGTAVDVCFSPLGRPFWRKAHTGTFEAMNVVPYVEVSPIDGMGRTRNVLVLPTGASRLAL